MRNFSLIVLIMLHLALALAAEQIYVANRAFKGRVSGTGSELRLSVTDLAEAMNLRAVRDASGWTVGGHPVSVTNEGGVDWIRLDQLPSELVRVVTNKELGTIDLYRAAGEGSEHGMWGAEGILLVFGTSWCPATEAMQPTVKDVSRSRVVRVVQVDIEKPNTPNFQEFAGYFEGNKVPLFVLLDSSGRKLTSFFGFVTYQELMATMEKHLGSFTTY